jgi:aspartyl-tRNA(Asn)/glutamyl-tRNA(Gln) amidotransferase subunit A
MLKNLTISKTKELLLNKEVSCLELVKEFFEYIEEKDKEINGFLSLRKEKALEEAKEIDKKISNNEDIGRLGGVPISVKDNILIKDEITTAGSKILERYKARYNADVIEKIKKEGAIILGKTNLDEFAMGASTESSAFQKTKNPLDLTRSPGGSSGGSAAVVSSYQSVVALGSDTAGSIRQPASFCGVVGMKPTYGSVSRSGLIALTSSLDQIGPLSRNVIDSAILFDIIRGRSKFDQTSSDIEFNLDNILNSSDNLKGLKVGIIKEYFKQKIDSDLESSFKDSVKILENLGAIIEEVSIPHIESSVPSYYIITPSEVSANLSRYDGLRYSSDENILGNLREIYSKYRGSKFGKEVRRRIVLGTFALSSGYYDAYYKKAKKVQKLIKNEFSEIFKKFDILISPTAPNTAFKIGEKIDNPLEMYLQDIFTVPVNIAGLTAISIPVFGKNSLPYGFQIIANSFQEEKMFKTASAFKKNYDNRKNN